MISPLNIFNCYYPKPLLRKTSSSISFGAKKDIKYHNQAKQTFSCSVFSQNLLRNSIIQKRNELLRPITDEKSYMKVLARILRYPLYKDVIFDDNDSSSENNSVFVKSLPLIQVDYINLDGYENVKNSLKGLISYCGAYDISSHINCWLTARKDNNPTLLTDKQMADVIRALDYSLVELDKIYGKFNGTVYRAGVFNPITDKQYYSGSDYLNCAVGHNLNRPPSKAVPYNIIRLKNGHYLHDFQKDTNSYISTAFAMAEREILIDRKSVFRLVPPFEYNDKDKSDISAIVFHTCNCDRSDLDFSAVKNMEDNIFVWDEL